MQSAHGYFDGKAIILSDSVSWKKDQRVLVTLMDEAVEIKNKNEVKYLGKITDDNYEILLEALSRGEEVEYEYDDPFFSLENVKRLTKAIKSLDEEGRGTFHDIIEVEMA